MVLVRTSFSLKMTVMSHEESLLTRMKAGDERAWDEAFRLLYPLAWSAARHPLTSLTPSEAEDVAIETLTLLVPKVASLTQWRDARALVVAMAARRAISTKRKMTAEKRGFGQTESLEKLTEDTEGVFEPVFCTDGFSSTDLNDLAGLLREALEEVDTLDGALVLEFIVGNVPYKELAARHQLPIGTVGVILGRTLKKIRTHLEKKPQLMKELISFLR